MLDRLLSWHLRPLAMVTVQPFGVVGLQRTLLTIESLALRGFWGESPVPQWDGEASAALSISTPLSS